ncbi:MAG: hypothetical protein II674_03265, partial [Prevotella sp.]|nr:hypothetical protein [Prevotella sp.]
MPNTGHPFFYFISKSPPSAVIRAQGSHRSELFRNSSPPPKKGHHHKAAAMATTSISTNAPFGKVFTATADLA